MKTSSIRRALTRRLLVGGGALVLLTCASAYLAMATALQQHFDETLIAKAEALVTASEIDEDGFEIDLVIQDFADFGVYGADYFEMRHRDGRVIARSPSAGRLRLPVRPIPPGQLEIDDAILEDGRDVRVLHRTFTPKDDLDGSYADVILTVATPRAPLDREIGLLALVLGVVGVLALVALVPVVRRSLAHGLGPLAAVNERLRAWDGDAAWRLDPAPLPQELRPLAHALNDALGRVATSLERERRFGSNAAHELRTPLAEVRALAETIARWPDDDPAGRAVEIVETSDRLARLVSQLLELARAEVHDGDGAERSKVPDARVRGIVDDALAARTNDAAERSLRFERSVTGVPSVWNAVLWERVVENLVGNAVAYAPSGATVHIELSPDGLSVTNPAPDLSPDDVAQLFEPFWRPGGGGDDASHSGLGLSIVRTCAERLGARAEAQLSGSALRVAVVWTSPSLSRND